MSVWDCLSSAHFTICLGTLASTRGVRSGDSSTYTLMSLSPTTLGSSPYLKLKLLQKVWDSTVSTVIDNTLHVTRGNSMHCKEQHGCNGIANK